MSINRDDVLKIAKLAHLQIAEAQIDTVAAKFNLVLSHIDKLNRADLKKVQAASAPSTPTPLRQDLLQPSLTPDAALKNAPERLDDFLLVPKVVES